jgi:signal transduction histidine kinase
MMGDGNEKGIYEILYEKGIFKKYWDMSIGFVWAATVGQRQIVEEQVAVAEDAKDRYLELNRHLENRVIERTAVIEKQKEEIEAANIELNNILDSLKLAQRKLIQSEKMASLGQLIAGIAHEINNPVNFISAGVDSLYTNLKDIKQVLDIYHRITPVNVSMKLEEIENLKLKVEYREAINEINELIASIKNGTNRTTEIVRSLRTFSHLDDDILKTSNIHDGLNSTLVLLHNKYKNRVEIIKHYGDIPMVKCYPGQLNQVFMNILSNAIDSIADKGIIKISTSRKDNYVQIIIKDSGHGISEKNMSRIFDPFFTTKGIGKGMGLGLSISQSIIEKHNGMIGVTSEPGKGCEFTISIPVQQE